jgi:hypothetical protein
VMSSDQSGARAALPVGDNTTGRQVDPYTRGGRAVSAPMRVPSSIVPRLATVHEYPGAP